MTFSITPLSLQHFSPVTGFPAAYNGKKLPGSTLIALQGKQSFYVQQQFEMPFVSILSMESNYQTNLPVSFQAAEGMALLFQKSGATTVSQPASTVSLSVNQFVLQETNTPHTCQVKPGYAHLFMIWISRQYWEDINNLLPAPVIIQKLQTPGTISFQLLESILAMYEGRYQSPFLDYYYDNRIKDILLTLAALSNEQQPPPALATPSEYEAIRQAAELITADLTKHWPIPALAKKVGINEYRLKTLFKERYGMGPFEFLTNKRMEQAKEWLQQDLSIKEVAALLGYRSTNFTAAFINYFGIPPSKFKNRR